MILIFTFMRKPLKSSKSQQRQKSKNSRIAGIALLLILVVSTFGIFATSFGEVSNPRINTINHNGQEFYLAEGFYVTDISNSRIYLRSHPKSIGRLSYEKDFYFTINNYVSEPLYLVSEFSDANSEIFNNLNPYAQRIQYACLDGKDCPNKDYPVKDCTDNLIIIEKNEANKITQENNCIFIQGKEQDLLTLTGKFILEIWGIR